MRDYWRRGWAKDDRREYMALKRLVNRALDASDYELSRDADLRWLRWQLDAKRLTNGFVADSYRSSLYRLWAHGY